MTGDEVLEWIDVHGWIVSDWQRDLIRRIDWSEPFKPLSLRPEPREPVQTRRVQRRRQTRAERRRARRLPQRDHFVIIDELPR